MAEAETSLTQRVESLERTSHERVVEQVAELGERVTGLESARDAESPHLATKADIARLETQVSSLSDQLQAQSDRFDERLQDQSDRFDERLQDQSDRFDERLQDQSDRFDERLQDQSDRFDERLQSHSEQFDERLSAQSEQLQKIIELRINRMVVWIVGTGIALAALILSRLPG